MIRVVAHRPGVAARPPAAPALAALALAAVTASCAAPPAIGTARFANRAPVWRVDDTADVAKKPPERPFPQKVYFFDTYLYSPVDHALTVPAPRHALDVNALDEVPDSTWFTNRIGVRDVTVDEMRRGPNRQDGPDASHPWRIKSSKTVGGSAGFVIVDARGDRYIIKFDEPQAPVTESATDVAVQRLLWALGYNVPENGVVYFRREGLELPADAVVKDGFGNKRPMTWADVDKQLARSYRRPDGSYRALVSRFLDGVPLGGFAQTGVNPADRNDTIPHEHRRSLRALALFFSWLQQTDAKEDNTLDTWVEDGGRHYLRHYLVDFGKSFGTSASVALRPGDGHRQNIDYGYFLHSLVTLGMWTLPYEGTPRPDIVGLGRFDADHYDPAHWQPHARYGLFAFVDHRDLLWAAKTMQRLTPALIRAAVEQGRYEDARAVDYLVEVLVARQHRAVRWALAQGAALDGFTLAPAGSGGAVQICFDDLLATSGLAPGAGATTSYGAARHDLDGRALGALAVHPGGARTACIDGVAPGPGADGYVIVRVDAVRGGTRLPAVEVHLARDPSSSLLRVIGVHRQ